ncbi:hypothetical protein [Beijerinckia sp. L45]|uniref:hypothetical protein n=1 Tax=Beijerinckia sp. L45 TaxID=1641855 RepID=UPI00131AB372|nr:hypothetical protein [Beijerinckia sp. L45]
MAATSSLRITVDLSKDLEKATKDLVRRELLIGIPGDGPARPPEPGEKTPPSNALLGYVAENGDEELKIPARPFLLPGVEDARDAITKGLTRAGKAVLDGDPNGLEVGFAMAGAAAVAAVKKKILEGSFAPLADSTLEARARRKRANGKLSQAESSKAARLELANRAAGVDQSTDAKPLYDTHSLFNSITYVIKDKGAN